MRKVLPIAAVVASATACIIGGLYAAITPAKAADLGKPATVAQIQALPSPQATTCYVETSAAGTFLRTTREAQGSLGGGCDTKITNLVVGAGVRADLSDWRNTGSLFLKLGLAVNAATNLYGTLAGTFEDWKLGQAGQLKIGAGIELKLEFIAPQLYGFGEMDITASKWGAGVEKDEIGTRLGLRYRF